MCKQIYTRPSGKTNTVQLNFNSIKTEKELYECIWIIFLYGFNYLEKKKHPEGDISLNITNITEKRFNKVQSYMKSLGINVRLITINKIQIQDKVKHAIKMYNYEYNKDLKILFQYKCSNIELKIYNMQTQEDKDHIDLIMKNIDYLEYIINIKKTTKSNQPYEFEKSLSFKDTIYLIRFHFCYN